MAMREEFNNTGQWLFRWRSYLPVLLIGIYLFAMTAIEGPGHDGTYELVWAVVSLGICFLGLAVRMHTIGHAASSTSGRNTKEQVADSLNTTGIYSVVRHPLYLGNFLMWAGIAVFSQTWWLAVICMLVFWIYYERIMFAEEEFLRGKFGDEFLEWAAVTPVFVPQFSSYRKPLHAFSIKTVLRKETDGFYAIIIILTMFEVVGGLFAFHRFEMNNFWWVTWGVGTLIWATLKLLKKNTNVLAEG